MKKNYCFGAMAFGLLLTACTSEVLEDTSNKVLENDQTFYVNMAIHGDVPSGTRADEFTGNPDADTNFEVGSPEENAINNAYFVFYDEDGNVVGDIVPVDIAGMTAEDQIDAETVEKYYTSTVPVIVKKGEKTPASVICYINPISPSTLQNPLNVIQTIARDRFKSNANGTEYFAMSNSVYYKDDSASTDPNIAQTIDSTQLYESQAEAEAALKAENKSLVNIYVERYASKLTFNNKATVTPYQTITKVYTDGVSADVPVTLTFVPQYWALNAEATTNYVIKSYREENAEGAIMADNYQFGEINGRINILDPSDYKTLDQGTTPTSLSDVNKWLWNNPNYHRSYWACSPAYFQSSYPEVASDVETAGVLNQQYLKYGELSSKGFAYATNNNTAKYFRETTVGFRAFQSENPAAAMPSVIFVGQYNVQIGENTVNTPDFYTYLNVRVNLGSTETPEMEERPSVYFATAANSVNSAVAGGESMLKRFFAQQTILFKAVTDEAGNTTHERYSIANAQDVNTLANGLEVAAISDDVKNHVGKDGEPLKLRDNARSLQFISPEKANGILIATGNGYKKVVGDDVAAVANDEVKISEANAILMQQVGYAYYYQNGKAYYNIPVKHYGWYRAGNENKNADRIDWTKVRVGDFGMVRNHSYNIEVNKIAGLASGISGDDVPIVPPADSKEYYIAYSVRILKWAVVPTQGVDL